jgi:hypothetical protein
MKLFEGMRDFLLTMFLFLVFVLGMYIQLAKNFDLGTAIVLLTLLIELMREISKSEKKRKLHWGDVIGVGFGATVSMVVLLFSLMLALTLEYRPFYILLMDSSLSTVVFLSSSLLKFWVHLKK